MHILKKYHLEIVCVFGLLIAYLLSRLLTLGILPIFTDEAIYMRWAQIAGTDANWRFISLTDGKQPLFIWIAAAFMRVIEDPLIAGRLVSVCAGFVSCIGLFFLTKELFRKHWIGIITASLYVIYPFSLVYDRMALYDSLVGTFAIWGLYGTVRLVKNLTLENALLLGFVGGGAALNKTNGFFIIYLLPFASILINWSKKRIAPLATRFISLSLVVVLHTYGIYFILRLSPFFYIINEKNAVFVYPFSEWIRVSHIFILTNTAELIDWFLRYFGPSFFVLAVYSFVLKKFFREKILLVLWFILPLIALAIFGKTLYPRYIFFMTLSLLPLVAFATYEVLTRYKNLAIRLLFLLFLMAYPLYVSFSVIADFPHSAIPSSDRNQYFSAWPSGVGIKESLEYFQREAEHNRIAIFTAGTFGLLPYSYEMYLKDNTNIRVTGFWPVNQDMPKEVVESTHSQPTYVVFYQPCHVCPETGVAPESWPVRQVLQFPRTEKDSYFTVYRVTNQ